MVWCRHVLVGRIPYALAGIRLEWSDFLVCGCLVYETTYRLTIGDTEAILSTIE